MLKTYFQKYIVALVLAQIILLGLSPSSMAIQNVKDIEGVGIDEKLGKSVPMDIKFRDSEGSEVTFGQFFDGKKPVILNLVYFSCPRVCTFAVTGLLEVMNGLDSLDLGDDYRVLTLSFNPDENVEIAKEKSVKFKKSLNKEAPDNSWYFLTGKKKNIKKLTNALGFQYKRDGKEYAHPSALIVLTPEGNISRYLYGIEHNTKDLKLSLLEAADGEIGSSETLNKVLLYCYQFDAVGKKYALHALNVVKAGGVVTLLFLGVFLSVLWKREKRDS